MKKTFCTVSLLLIFAFTFISCTKDKWVYTFEDAKNQCTKNEKDILMIIRGDDETSQNFIGQLKSNKNFASLLQKKYVFLDANVNDENHPEVCSKIERDYYIEYLPGIFVLSKEGYVIRYIQYEDKYLSEGNLEAEVLSFEEANKTIKDKIANTNSFTGNKKLFAIDELYEATDIYFRHPLDSLCEEVPALDEKNTSGLLGKYELINAYAKCMDYLISDEKDKACFVFEKLVQNGHLDKSQMFEAAYQGAWVYAITESQRYDRMLDLLQTAYENTSDATAQTHVQDMMDNAKIMQELCNKASQEIKEDEYPEDLSEEDSELFE